MGTNHHLAAVRAGWADPAALVGEVNFNGINQPNAMLDALDHRLRVIRRRV